MNPQHLQLNTLLSERQRLQGESEKLAERARAASEQIAGAEREANEASAAIEQYNSEVAEAIGAGSQAPEPTGALRAAAAKIATVHAKIAALRGAIKLLEQQKVAVAEQVAAIEAQIKVERAKLMRPICMEQQTQRAEANDQVSIGDGVAAHLRAALFAADPRIAGEVMSELEQARLEWLQTRDGRIATEIARRTGELLGKIPA